MEFALNLMMALHAIFICYFKLWGLAVPYTPGTPPGIK